MARDGNGIVQCVWTDLASSVRSSMEAEGISILQAMRCASKERRESCTFETDCAEVYHLIYLNHNYVPSCCVWAYECSKLLVRKEGWKLSLIL